MQVVFRGLPFRHDISGDDFCVTRLGEKEAPICTESCQNGGVKYGEFEENIAENIYRVSDNLFVKTSFKWERVEAAPKKR
jgi:Fe-S-cluster-containing dehydrogenase component